MNKDGDEVSDNAQAYELSPKVTFSLPTTTTKQHDPKEVEQSGPPSPSQAYSDQPKLKRKRKSPDKPWKKPPDMPKRPLSAYNLFFKDERERILSQMIQSEGKGGAELLEMEGLLSSAEDMNDGTGGDDEKNLAVDRIEDSKRSAAKRGTQSKKSGVGFAGLAKKISTKWNNLDEEEKEPYEKIASVDKKRYEDAVALWRKAKKEEKSNESKVSSDDFSAVDKASNKSVSGYDPLLGSSHASYFNEMPIDTTHPLVTRQPLHSFDESQKPKSSTAFSQRFDNISERSASSYPAEWFETNLEVGGSERRIESLPRNYEFALPQREIRPEPQLTRDSRADRIRQQEHLTRQEHTYAFAQGASRSALYPERTSTNIAYDIGSSTRSENPEAARGRYHEIKRRQQERDMERLHALEQYQSYLQRQEEIKHRQEQVRQQEIQLQKQIQIQQHRQQQMQINQETGEQQDTRTIVIMHKTPQDVDSQHQYQGMPKTSFKVPPRYESSPYSHRSIYISNPAHPREHLPSMQSSRPTTPEERMMSSRNETNEGGLTPLTPIFGLPFEEQLANSREDHPFLLDTIGAAQPPIQQESASRVEENRRSFLPAASQFPSSIFERSQESRWAQSSALRPRRTSHHLYSNFQGNIDANIAVPLEHQDLAGSSKRIALDYSLSESTSTHPATRQHRSVSMSQLPANPGFQEAQREEDHRRFSLTGRLYSSHLEGSQEINLESPTERTSRSAPDSENNERTNIRQVPDVRVSRDQFWPLSFDSLTAGVSHHEPANPQLQQEQRLQQHSSDDHMIPESILTTTIQSLSEKLDDEAIDFLTRMNKER